MNDRIVLRNVARVLTEEEIEGVSSGSGTSGNGSKITPGQVTHLPTSELGGVIDEDRTTGDF